MNHREAVRVALSVPDSAPRSERPLLLLGLVATLTLLAGVVWWLSGEPWFGQVELTFVVGFVLAATVVGYGVAREQVGPRIWLAALMGLAPLAYAISDWTDFYALDYPAGLNPRIEVLAALTCTAGSIGVLARKSWARWLALAAALAGMGTGSLNLLGQLGDPSAYAWVYSITVVFSGIVGVALLGPSVRAEFETEGADGIWSSKEPAVRAIRWTVLSQLVAVPMLLVYAWSQPIVLETRTAAVVLAFVLGGAALLSMGRKLAGPVLLVFGGPALLVLTAVTAWHAQAMEAPALNIIGYYACFWVPAGVISTVAGCVLARPVLRLWKQLD